MLPKDAKPIFVNSVKEMTFTDALQISERLRTMPQHYFSNKKLRPSLANCIAPKIRESLNKNLVAGISTQQSWKRTDCAME